MALQSEIWGMCPRQLYGAGAYARSGRPSDVMIMFYHDFKEYSIYYGVIHVVVVVLSNVDAGDPRCPIHGEDAIFTHKL